MRQGIREYMEFYRGEWYLPEVRVTDVIEILIIAFLVYHLMLWIRNTKAWMLLKGIAVLAIFILLAAIFNMNTILWLARNSINVLATAAIVVFQPELRRALEKIGQRDFWNAFMPFERTSLNGKFTEETIEAIVSACYEMGKVKTGALIVVERDIVLTEYEHTGIALDCIVSNQVLINIFEHNTPLHDGAVIIRGDRVASATCYLPLTDSLELGKELGTRHRAAVGISEVSDSYTVVVSEETGAISLAHERRLIRNLTGNDVRYILMRAITTKETDKTKFKLWKGRRSNEDKSQE